MRFASSSIISALSLAGGNWLSVTVTGVAGVFGVVVVVWFWFTFEQAVKNKTLHRMVVLKALFKGGIT
jgi:hypothetical protein